MNVSSILANVEFVRGSVPTPNPITRFPRRYWTDSNSVQLHQPPSRSLHLNCLLESTISIQDPELRVDSPPTYVTANGRVIAIGDLHGDLNKTIRALELAQVVRPDSHGLPVWCGGDSVVVQLGDVFDRGDCEIGILMLLRELHNQAQNDGGAVFMLNGNHESLNICGNFRYVTPGAFYESALAAGLTKELSFNWDDQLKARLELYSPGGLVACELAKNPTVLIVNDTVFAHGGLLPIHVNYGLERVNREMAAWMRGDVTITGKKAMPPYIAMGGANSILWNRTLAKERFDTPYARYYACSLIKSVLRKLKVKRLVVGHTPQMSGCNCECNGQIWRVDVGMSEGVLNAEPQLIVIEEDSTGKTITEVIHSKSGSLTNPQISDRNNIQTAFGIESSSVQRSMNWMTKELVSRLNSD